MDTDQKATASGHRFTCRVMDPDPIFISVYRCPSVVFLIQVRRIGFPFCCRVSAVPFGKSLLTSAPTRVQRVRANNARQSHSEFPAAKKRAPRARG
jgi:hypothetical protein